MTKLLATVTVIALIAVPALAAKKAPGCTQASIASADAKIAKMPDGESKTAAMQEMTSAKSSMTQQDMAGCSEHMAKAMKASAAKPKRM